MCINEEGPHIYIMVANCGGKSIQHISNKLFSAQHGGGLVVDHLFLSYTDL